MWDLQQHLEQDRQLMVLDVRQPQEWSEEVPKDRPVAVLCGSGYRSSAIASLLQHRGHPTVMNIVGGMGGWRAAGLKTMQD